MTGFFELALSGAVFRRLKSLVIRAISIRAWIDRDLLFTNLNYHNVPATIDYSGNLAYHTIFIVKMAIPPKNLKLSTVRAFLSTLTKRHSSSLKYSPEGLGTTSLTTTCTVVITSLRSGTNYTAPSNQKEERGTS